MGIFSRKKPPAPAAPTREVIAEDSKSTSSETSSGDKVKSFLKKSIANGASAGKDGLLKGKLKLQHSLGLGRKPNVIPPGTPSIRDAPRTVHIGWHPVAGSAGKWFAEETVVGKFITDKVHKYPDPTQHWAVLVGDYGHELWMDEDLNIIYVNEVLEWAEWRTFEVGTTTFNDEAIRQASEAVIYDMRVKRPAYHLISNNCQTFALALLDAVQVGSSREFATSYAVYRQALGPGSVADLFAHDEQTGALLEGEAGGQAATQAQAEAEADAQAAAEEKVGGKPVEERKRRTIVEFAKQLMDEHTTKLDNHHCVH
ncbi:hypothetical protein B0T14DRAFT_523549 [Immersiella caudata]|uniref:DUF862-domain-containing protein n=1 Tax=Immersiella caudata TaxID=314043 RepID=A0AA39WJN1_9PEZI|nr:hypothetical protein B0T14DRAFT_523549 [Immersiella caudata]